MAEALESRKCILTGETKQKSELLRFAVLPDGSFLPDFNKKLGGKGVYLSNAKSILQKATENPKMGKVLHKKVNLDKNLPELVEHILSAKGLEALNLARKSGSLVLGFEKVKEGITKNKVAFVVEATDAGEDGKKKMDALCKNLEKFVLYDSETLDKTFDRENVVYLAVLKGDVSSMVYDKLKFFESYLNA